MPERQRRRRLQRLDGDVAADLADDRQTEQLARLEAENWRGTRYTDFFVLIRTDGAWRIDSKVFFAHSRA